MGNAPGVSAAIDGRKPSVVSGEELLALISAMLRELRGEDVPPIDLDDELDRTLGVDSLARMELMLRMERAFNARLPDAAVQEAQTPRDLLRALAAATPRGPVPVSRPTLPAADAGAAAVTPPRHARTLVEVLQWHAERAPDRRHLCLIGDGPPAQELTCRQLWDQAHAVAASLRHWGLAPGEAVAMMLPTSLAFFRAFMGVLLAGAVPVPIYPPLRASQIEDHLRRQAGILVNARAVLLLSDGPALPAARILRASVPSLRAALTLEGLAGRGSAGQPANREAQGTALLQYTSGSTGQPKGVVLSHANLLANIRAMGEAVKADASDVFVSWLPLYHDMGLIGAWLGSLYHGVPLYLMPPQTFLARPSRWLHAISDYRATLSAAPNFAYEILATRVPDDELEGLDLRSWRAALNGAEPVHAATLERFAARFAAQGFDARAMMPVYGLAESGVGLAFPPLARGPRIDSIDRGELEASGRAVVAAPARPAMRVVSCGLPLPGHEIRVVDPRGQELPERSEGRIEFRGPSATAGYVRNPEATRALFRGGWLDTGDVGYVAEGELFLTSRAKDLIIRGGQHIHPYDLEQALDAVPGIRRGCVAVFAATDPGSGTERVVVLVETRLQQPQQRAELRARVADLSLAVLGVPADDIVLAEPRTVLKTSSGKIRRAACRALYEQGRLGGRVRPVPLQIAALWFDAFKSRVGGPATWAAALVYAAWLWTVFCCAAAVAAAAALVPERATRKRAVRAIARGALGLSLLPIEVEGDACIVQGPVVVVANHASYIDSLLLIAVLPARACFVAKDELGRLPPVRWLLSRIGTRFVVRDDVHASVEDARRLAQAAQAGETLVFFPEGTFGRAPGLKAFHLGAFATAAQAHVAVLPVSLRGTRSVLRDGSWWPRRSAVRIHFGALVQPQATDWAEAVRLRDAARLEIGAHCAEPVLAGPAASKAG
jgi:1-acyl-sn-glycerol-3-phosphate acyltransferase